MSIELRFRAFVQTVPTMTVYRAAVVAIQIWLVKNSGGVSWSVEGRMVLSRQIMVSVVRFPGLVRLNRMVECWWRGLVRGRIRPRIVMYVEAAKRGRVL